MAEKKKRRWGDRRDGRLVRTTSAMHKIEPFIMVKRSDACNMFADEVDVTEVEKYILEKKKTMPNFTMLHFMTAAYVRTVAARPGINRFISGQRIYTRDTCEVNLCIKKEMTAESPDSVLSVDIDPGSTIEEIYKIIDDAIVQTRTEDTSFDGVAEAFNRLPRLFKKFLFWFLRVLDYFGLLPSFLTKLSPFHGSFFITSMASLGLPPVFHHIYDFGNVPIFMAIGITKRRHVLRGDSTTEVRRFMQYTVVTDERIVDGFYFALAFRYLTGIIRNPWSLDKPAEVKKDID